MVIQVHFTQADNAQIEAVWDNGFTKRFEWPLTSNIKPAPVPSERDPNPTDYWKYPREVKEWLDAGNTPVAYDPDYGLTAEEITERDERAAAMAEFDDSWGSFTPAERAALRAAFRHENFIREINAALTTPIGTIPTASMTKAQFATWVQDNT